MIIALLFSFVLAAFMSVNNKLTDALSYIIFLYAVPGMLKYRDSLLPNGESN
jgi:hypothetical protein